MASPLPIPVHIRTNPDTEVEDLGIGGLVINLRTLQPTAIDRSGLAMWKALSASSNLDEALELLLAVFVVERSVLERDLAAFVTQLAAIGLLEFPDEPQGDQHHAGVTPSVDAQAVMEQRHHDGVQALITHARTSGISGGTVTVGSDGPVGSAAVAGPIAVLHLTPSSLPTDVLIDLCRRVAAGGLVIVDPYDDPSRRQIVDEIRSELAITSPMEILDWSGVWWRM